MLPSRREVLAGLSAAAVSSVAGAASVRPPNVLFVMTDQHRHDALSCAGRGFFQTPNIDRLAAEGVRFSHHFCASPLCTPARAALLTGLTMDRHGLTRNVPAKRAWGGGFQTWEERLAGAGYHCRYFGKWHTGDGHMTPYVGGIAHYRNQYKAFLEQFYPERELAPGQKRDRYFDMPYTPLPIDDMMLAARRSKRFMPHHNEAGEIDIDAAHTPTAHVVDQTIRFLRTAPEPFSVTCSILSPHAPMLLPRPWLGRHDPADAPLPSNIVDDHALPRPSAIPDIVPADASGVGAFVALYADMVEEVDHHVGRLLRALRTAGLDGRTVVVFTADHGEMMGSHGTFAKSLLFDEALRVPLIVRAPGGPAGVVDARLCSSTEVATTILARAGIESRLPGRDLLTDTTDRGPIVSEFETNDGDRARTIRTQRHKLILRGGRARLYNLENDAGEQHNLLSRDNTTPTHRQRADQLRDQLVAWAEDNDAAHLRDIKRARMRG